MPYWTDNEMLLLMAISFLIGLSLSWFIRTLKSIDK